MNVAVTAAAMPKSAAAQFHFLDLSRAPQHPPRGTESLTYSLRAFRTLIGPEVVLWCHTCDTWCSYSDSFTVERVPAAIAEHEQAYPAVHRRG